jgi:hypothetical protein
LSISRRIESGSKRLVCIRATAAELSRGRSRF